MVLFAADKTQKYANYANERKAGIGKEGHYHEKTG